MPYNVADGNSIGYNYASGWLDHRTYDKSRESSFRLVWPLLCRCAGYESINGTAQ
jgi:hypothetical protein